MGIVGDVTAIMLVLLFRPDEVIETVLLPESSRAADAAIDLAGRIVLPRFALLQHRRFIEECSEQMDIVRRFPRLETSKREENRVMIGKTTGQLFPGPMLNDSEEQIGPSEPDSSGG